MVSVDRIVGLPDNEGLNSSTTITITSLVRRPETIANSEAVGSERFPVIFIDPPEKGGVVYSLDLYQTTLERAS